MPFTVPQTILQLWPLLEARGYDADDLNAVERAYVLQCRLFGTLYSGSGKNHTAHGVGVAAIIASVGGPRPLVEAAMVHNAYDLGDFGDGLERVATDARRSLIADTVGARAERAVHRFFEMRWTVQTAADFIETAAGASEEVQDTLLLRIADDLEHHVDGGLRYRLSPHMLDRARALRPHLPLLADALGYPALNELLQEAYAELDDVPPPSILAKRAVPRRLIPQSYTLKPRLRLDQQVTALRRDPVQRIRFLASKIVRGLGPGRG